MKNMHVGKNKKEKRNENDFYPTPPIATKLFIEYARPPLEILEPCAGQGWISKALIDEGFSVISTDLNEYGDTLVPVKFGIDFFDLNINDTAIVTNPPYSSKFPERMIRHSLKRTNYLALFLRINFLESATRHQLFKEYPPTDVYVMSDRINFINDPKNFYNYKSQLGGMICYAWYVWDYRYNSLRETKLHFLSAKEFINEQICK